MLQRNRLKRVDISILYFRNNLFVHKWAILLVGCLTKDYRLESPNANNKFRFLLSRQILVPTHSSIIVQRQKIMTC